MREHVMFRGIVRNHYALETVNGPPEKRHASYRNMLHALDDTPQGQLMMLDGLPIPSDKVIEILVRVTDEDAPVGRDLWVLQRPHHYGPLIEISTCAWCGLPCDPMTSRKFTPKSLAGYMRQCESGHASYHTTYTADGYGESRIFREADDQTMAAHDHCWPHIEADAAEAMRKGGAT